MSLLLRFAGDCVLIVLIWLHILYLLVIACIDVCWVVYCCFADALSLGL